MYEGRCDTCGEVVGEDGEEVVSLYHGRSSRCLYTRQREHFEGLAKKKEDSPLFKHKEKFHPGVDCKFSFRAEKFFREPCSSAIYEGVSINHSPSSPDHLMNSKSEFEQGQVARVVLERGLRS